MPPIRIQENWDKTPATRQWLLDNPGSVILPRTIVATIRLAAQVSKEASVPHDEEQIAPEDRAFIQAQREQLHLRPCPALDGFPAAGNGWSQ